MKFLVLQHGEFDHHGVFRRFFTEDGHTWQAVRIDEDAPLPPLDGFDGLVVGGGMQDTWQEDEFPWLIREKALVREAVAERGMLYLGLCLGHQLLACALGGEVGPTATPEVGVMPVRLTGTGLESRFTDGLPEEFPVLQWHGAEITRLPEGAEVLAATEKCAVQAMSWGRRAVTTQFHLEADILTAAEWTASRVARDTLDVHLGPGGADRLIADCEANMAAFNANAERIYLNWLYAERT